MDLPVLASGGFQGGTHPGAKSQAPSLDHAADRFFTDGGDDSSLQSTPTYFSIVRNSHITWRTTSTSYQGESIRKDRGTRLYFKPTIIAFLHYLMQQATWIKDSASMEKEWLPPSSTWTVSIASGMFSFLPRVVCHQAGDDTCCVGEPGKLACGHPWPSRAAQALGNRTYKSGQTGAGSIDKHQRLAIQPTMTTWFLRD